MKVAVFSDTHRNTGPMLEALLLCRPDAVVHLGDHDRDTLAIERAFPELPLYRVCGNCDLAPIAPLADIVQLGPVKAFLCHGHQYGVDWGELDRLAYAAQERGCSLALYGHTHRASQEELGGVQLINPGTAGSGRRLSWALLEILDNGGVACSINEL
ncbi:MAG: metallophosphoesterase [Oscillospiraceae bacterium]|nr:metallophosphoesterase [Oscillospiraceae bacterium]